MSSVMNIVQRAAIGGYVRDAFSGGGIPDAKVTVVGQARVARTDPDGFYFFVNLPVGSYTLEAYAPALYGRYGSITAMNVVVAVDAAGRPVLDTRANLTLSPTRLSGRVCRADGSGVARSQIWLRAVNLKTIANSLGEYAFSAIQAGTQTAHVTAPGFSLLEQRVELRTGETTHTNFTLNGS